MKKEDWLRVVKWMGYVYLPILLLIVLVFVLVEWNAYKLAHYQNALTAPALNATTTLQ